MKIAHILPHGAKFPLVKHNGRYEWALRLARLQARAGHDVTIFSGTNEWKEVPEITWRSCPQQATREDTNRALFAEAFADESFDVFHSHFDSLHSLVGNQTKKPIVCTQHWFPTTKIAEAARQSPDNVMYVPVTHHMQHSDKEMGIPCSEVIYHGIDLSLFQPQTTKSDRLIFVGRISPNKGVKEAVEIARRANVPLDIYGKVNESDRQYFESFSHLIDGETIVYHGSRPIEEIAAAMAQAKALLFPSQSAEAFGQVTIEAQACGTPVIISDIGASSELVLHGSTGFVVHTMDQYTEAINALEAIDRQKCREHAERFSVTAMLQAYEALYEKLRK